MSVFVGAGVAACAAWLLALTPAVAVAFAIVLALGLARFGPALCGQALGLAMLLLVAGHQGLDEWNREGVRLHAWRWGVCQQPAPRTVVRGLRWDGDELVLGKTRRELEQLFGPLGRDHYSAEHFDRRYAGRWANVPETWWVVIFEHGKAVELRYSKG